MENTVKTLEVELAALLEAVEAPKWRPLLENAGKREVDILDEPQERAQN